MTLDFRKLKILLVHGNTAEASALSAMLTGFGVARIDHAVDVASALRLLKLGRLYDAMLCDFNLGSVNSLSLVKVIRRDNKLTNRYMPIVVLTGRTAPERLAAIRATGVNDLLTKPIGSHILFSSLQSVLSHARSFIETKTYFGPDRRQRQHDGMRGRRRDDAKAGVLEDIFL